MVRSQISRTCALLTCLLGAAFAGACQMQAKPTFHQNIPPLENSMIELINQQGPGDRYVINKVNVSDEVVDWFIISLTSGRPYAALSESGASTVGLGAVVQFCGWGDFLGLEIFTEYPYLCRRGEGLVFGVTKYGWVHLYGTGEIAGTRISIKKPS